MSLIQPVNFEVNCQFDGNMGLFYQNVFVYDWDYRFVSNLSLLKGNNSFSYIRSNSCSQICERRTCMISHFNFLDRRSKGSASLYENKNPQIMACYIIPFILSGTEVCLLSSLWLRVKLMKAEFVFTQKLSFLILKVTYFDQKDSVCIFHF